ncbi:MAG: hypothetical protein QF893_03235, partial [Alphaproteobacteria bacterium]|nr:hypothetical protein [Alphaproteobacteria bacterium]
MEVMRSRIGLVVIGLMLISETTWAQDARDAVLERQLRERDKVILELLHRVEVLEKRFGVQRLSDQGGDTPKLDVEEDTAQAPGTVTVDARAA